MNAEAQQSVSSETGERERRRATGRQIAVLTLAALCLYAVIRRLPTGTNLSHMDFRAGAGSIEFCDPANPQFLPVVAVRSPVIFALNTRTPARAGLECEVLCTLKTSTGKAIDAADLAIVHTEKLHVMIVDPTLRDYQHVHPEPLGAGGQWRLRFKPRFGGAYRFFADFTPVATGRGLYAAAEFAVRGEPAKAVPPSERAERGDTGPYRLELKSEAAKLIAGQPLDLQLTIGNAEGGRVSLEPIMGAYAHLVAFDEGRKGFAHLHPQEAGTDWKPDSQRPTLNFRLTVPEAGEYVIWAQVKLKGEVIAQRFGIKTFNH